MTQLLKTAVLVLAVAHRVLILIDNAVEMHKRRKREQKEKEPKSNVIPMRRDDPQD